MARFRNALALSTALALVSASALAAGTKPAPAAKAAHAAKRRPAPPLSANHKKALAELYAGFKFGMTKDDVLGVLQKQIDEASEDKLKATTDIAAQDRIRRDRKAELARIASSYTAFETKSTGWDVSIIAGEFAHNTGESLMDRWENSGGKNQRRFFFFYNGRLWKMFVSLDVSILPEDKKNFETFRGILEGKYGGGDVGDTTITWRAGDFDVRAIDRLKDYDALGLVIEDPRTRGEVEALRVTKAPPKEQISPVIKAIVDPDDKDHPNVKSDSGAVDAVIKAQGGPAPRK